MAENFFLGFTVDTSQLQRAQELAKKFAEDVGKLGTAEQETAKKTDQATEAVKRKKKATEDAAEAQRKAAGATGEFARKLEGISGNLKKSQEDLQALAGAIGGGGGMGGMVGGINAGAGALGRLAGALGPVGAGIAAATVAVGAVGFGYYKAAESLAKYEDRLNALEGKLKNSLGSIYAAREAIDALRESTQRTGLGFDAAAEAFGRIARNNSAIGLTQKEMLQMVDTVQKLGVVSGASAGEMQSGMIQFGQALASGRLQGDELRSIMENFPALAKAIADNFERADGTIGLTIGELRKMGSEGELTSIKIAQAMLRAKELTEKQFAEMPETVERANQRLSDSYDALLTDLAKKWGGSEFVRGVKGIGQDLIDSLRRAIADPSLEEQIAALQKKLQYSQQYHSAGAFTRGMLSSGGGYGAPANIPETPDAIRGQITALEQQRANAQKAADEQAAREAELKLTAGASGVIARTAELKTFEEQARDARVTVNDITGAIDGLNKALTARKASGADFSDLTLQIETLNQRLVIARQRQADVVTELGKLQRAASDRASGLQLGGVGGASIVMQAIQARRSDNARNGASSLDSYIRAILRDDLLGADADLESIRRQTAATTSGMETIGADRATARAAEVQRKYNEEAAKFGAFATRPEVLAYLARYKAAQEEAALATDKASDATRAYRALQDYNNQLRLEDAGADPRSQRRAALENQLAQDRLTFSDPAEFARYADAKRQMIVGDEELQMNQASRQYDLRLRQLQEQEKLVGLTSDELQVQNAILAKQMELWSQGYAAGEERFDMEVRRTEELERAAVEQKNRQAGVRSIFNALQDGVREFEGTFKSAFETIFTDGVKKGGDVFFKGFGDIIKRISAQMIYDIAIRPFEVLAQQAATSFAKWLTGFFSAPAGAPVGTTAGKNGMNGAYFDGMNHNFAYGGAFTNQIVSRPTMFAFASGIGLMGEAGPEAIMPLKRDASGRLGVYASGGGGNDSGLSVVINDMRSNANSERVQTSESRGPNGKRVLSVLIRDEMRRQIRSGDMDREMAGSYGNTRTLARL